MAEDTRNAIRDVAVELFAQHGYERTSLREIAERLGMTKAALYYHYPSKQSLLLAIIEPLIAEWKTAADKAETMPHNVFTVRHVLGESLDVLLRYRKVAVMFTRDTPALFEAMGNTYEKFLDIHQRFHTWLAGPTPSGADRIRAFAATEVLGAALGLAAFGNDSDEELREVLLDAASAVLRLQD